MAALQPMKPKSSKRDPWNAKRRLITNATLPVSQFDNESEF